MVFWDISSIHYVFHGRKTSCLPDIKYAGYSGGNEVEMDMSEKSLEQWLATLTEEEREQFVEVMKDDNTFLAENMEDVVAILNSLREDKTTH